MAKNYIEELLKEKHFLLLKAQIRR